MESNIPSWSLLQIEDAAKLLGFYVGPGCGKLNFAGPLEKLVGRVKDIKSAAAPTHINAYDYNSRVCPILGYHAQLLPLDKRHFLLERIALHTVLRAPWNTFRHSDFFQLHKIGGPKFRSFNVACASALYRTATRTVCSWQEWIEQMTINAKEHLSVRHAATGQLYPDCWDSPSFAHNLKWAFEGFGGDETHHTIMIRGTPRLLKAGTALKHCLATKNSGVYPAPGSEFFRNFRSLQKHVYSILMEHIFPDEPHTQLNSLCFGRCIKLFAPYEVSTENGVDVNAALNLLSTTSGPIGIKVVKTWLNGWATSHRMHEDNVHCCLLGCRDEQDSLNHYIHCPHLFALQRFLFSGISENPLIRFGIQTPEIFSFKVISCLFSAYHALKSEVRSGKINMHYQTWLQSAWSVFANVCKAEAGELGVSTRAFSLVKFIDFLITGRLPSPTNNLLLHDHIET